MTAAAATDSHESSGVVRIASVAALGGLLFGYDSAVINGAVSAVQNEFKAQPGPLGFAVAAALIGAAVGAFTGGRVADRIGRLAVMKIAALLFLVSAIGCGFAPNLALFVTFRIIGGLGVGVASVIAPAYIAEISPPRIRGRLGSLQQLAIVTGIFVSLLVDFLLARIAGSSSAMLWFGMEAWRWMFMMMAVPAIVYGALSFTIPESPRFLVAQGQPEKAQRVLARVLGVGAQETVERIQQSLATDRKRSMRDLRSPRGGIFPIVWVGIGLAVFQQFVGINVIFYYSNVLWEAVGFTESSSFVITVLTSVTNILTTLIAIAAVDKAGRKPLLMIGSTGMFVSLAVMAYIFQTAPLKNGAPVLEGAAGPVALAAANIFVIAFGMSWGPVMWIMLGEMFPNRLRGAALAVAGFAQWAANWIVTVSFPILKDISLGLAYGLYALCALLSLLFVWRFVHETKGLALEDMEDGFVPAGH
ncbi:sugar porter family MFS transporter [Cumulibacter manganitolerans]|uniref:sugar porter family MFS transporter n=1 Tax=Cumulibacter manganitolerans TaxID=1884992 RepID=UPI0012978284|nr:sugar porter family MFS transporter [Cumulibacter manganitolerans]